MEASPQQPGAASGQGPAQTAVGDRVQLHAKDLLDHRRPSRCDLRIYLREQHTPVAPPSPFDEMIRRLGQRHEVAELTKLQPVVNLGVGSLEQRAQWTRDEVGKGAPVIYQGVLMLETELGGMPATVVAEPDFLVASGTGYAMRESRLAGRATQQEHLEVVLALQAAGWLFRETLEQEPAALEVATGSGAIIAVVDDGGAQALGQLAHLAQLKRLVADLAPPPFEPVNWLKCQACAFVRYCWVRAVERYDVACIPAIAEPLARALHEQGVTGAARLVEAFDDESLAAFVRPAAGGDAPVGEEAAVGILRSARAFASGREEVFATPDVLLSDNYAVFDSEGLPPQFDELDKVYVWGMQVYGTLPSPYTAAMATGDPDGDRIGWVGFLTEAAALFEYYGDIPFVHWLDDERRAIDRYVARYGDPDGVAARVLANMIDLEVVMRESIAVPLPSNSLKAISKYAGSKRDLDQYGRDWSLAKYIEVVETGDEFQRSGLVGQVQSNNREDLEATNAVLRWLLSRAAERR